MSSLNESVNYLEELKKSISVGDINAARRLAQQLAESNSKQGIEDDSSSELLTKQFLPYNSILIRASVELWTGEENELEDIAIVANSEWKILNLRQHVQEKYGIPAPCQYWFFCRNKYYEDNHPLSRIPADKDPKTTFPLLVAQLYLRPDVECDPLGRKSRNANEPGADDFEFVNSEDAPPFRPNSSNPFASLAANPITRQHSEGPLLSLRPNLSHSAPMLNRNANTSSRGARKSPDSLAEEAMEVAPAVAPKTPPPPAKPKDPEPPAGWMCPTCTFMNAPTRPGCEMCSTERPADYKPSADALDELNLTPNERRRLQLLRDAEESAKLLERVEAAANEEHRLKALQELEQLAGQALLVNAEEFECVICFTDVAPGDGVRLHECLHQFCKDCLKRHVETSETSEIRCPFRANNYACDALLEEREIREICGKQEYERYLALSLQRAEAAAGNAAFHCITPNCPGFAFLEKDGELAAVNFFKCPICSANNCTQCRAIHDGMNCRQYQEDIRTRAVNDEAARQTQLALDEMLRSGEAMKCPKCGVLVAKREGCDWMQCSMCRVEICWATKGPRWGPNGRGDNTGGCRCNVNGRRCMPNCGNCH